MQLDGRTQCNVFGNTNDKNKRTGSDAYNIYGNFNKRNLALLEQDVLNEIRNFIEKSDPLQVPKSYSKMY